MSNRAYSRTKNLLKVSLVPLSLLSFSPVALSSIGQQLIIDDIVCEGNTNTECDFITKKYYQAIGDVLDPDEIADAKLRLGTLFQFRSVNTRLTKGNKRGHVVVVFEVQEAKNVQYQLATGYYDSRLKSDEPFCYEENFSTGNFRSCSQSNFETHGPSFSASVIDFNFLGSGKQLSFGVTGSVSKGDVEYIRSFQRNDEPLQTVTSNTDSDSTRYNMALEYYDPHLFDTSLYYFRARVSHQRGRYDENTRVLDDTQQGNEPQGTRYSNSTPVHFEAGRRFGSHSYVSLNLGGYYLSSDNTHSVGISYGWDSQDDSLFPTQGSVFAASLNFMPEALDNASLGLSYMKHFELSENNILTLGNRTSYTFVDRHFASDHQLGSDIYARFTDITAIDKSAGTYSGWYIEGNMGATTSTEYTPKHVEYGIRGGYTYQSDSMIYRFSLGFSHQEHN